ncbi:MAG TPA: hypothetical protein PLU30_12835 [Verrucomicrobiae bacterium]|nr:hypothetical protein [Verrucomicrobiae bacterium]
MNAGLCEQEPSHHVFLPAKYTLRIYDNEAPEALLLYFQATTSFPPVHAGDVLRTSDWPPRLKGRPAHVERVEYSVYSMNNQVWCETHVFCRFHPGGEAWPIPAVSDEETRAGRGRQ